MQRMIETTQKNLFLVSHLPFVDRLVAQLLVSRDINIVHFRPATLVILDYIGDRWYLAACIYPELLMEKE
jgi:phosphohistidine phosphatase SixA